MTATKQGTLVLAALVLSGLVGGFLVATTISGRAFATVGTAEGQHRAYALGLDGDRVRLSLDATGEASPSAHLALYDPEDRFFGTFELAGEGDHVDVLADTPGRWVVFLLDLDGGNLDVQLPTEDTDATEALEPIRVETVERTVARNAEPAPVDARLADHVEQRPAFAKLVVDGNASDLSASVATDHGPVYEIEDGRVNTTAEGVSSREGLFEAHPGNLAIGTYEVNATAQILHGELLLVYETYDRDDPLEEAPGSTSLPDPPPGVEGTTVAQLAEGEPMLIHPTQAEDILFAARGDTWARVLVFNASDQVTGLVHVGERDGYGWDWTDDERLNGSYEQATFALQDPGPHVVYVDELFGDDATVLAVLPGVDGAPPARALSAEETTVALEHAMGPGSDAPVSRETTLAGGLLNARVDVRDVASGEHRVTVEGPTGLLLEHTERGHVSGFATEESHTVHPGNFTAGRVFVQVETDAIQGSTEVTLRSYVR